MNTFKHWLYNEAFDLPFSSLKPIYDYYAYGYKLYLRTPRSSITPKVFDLDLSETKYKFLQPLQPAVKITLRGTIPGADGTYNGIIYDYSYDQNLKTITKKVGNITLALKNFEHVNYSTIEHEVLHYLQDLMRDYIKQKPKHDDSDLEHVQKSIRKKWQLPRFGGLTKQNILDRVIGKKDPKVFDADKKAIEGEVNVRRTKHEYRPIEHYTNLSSLIKGLQYLYAKFTFEVLEIKNDEDFNNKKSEFLKMMNDPKDKMKFFTRVRERKGYIVSDLEKIKQFDGDLYKIYLREVYKNFINKDFSDDILEIKKMVDTGHADLFKKEEVKREKKEKEKEKRETSLQLSEKWKEADFGGRLTIDWDIEEFSNLYDSRWGTDRDVAEAMFRSAGIKQNQDYETYSLPLNTKNLFRVFNNIKKSRESFTFYNMPKDIIKCNFDYMAKRLARHISARLHEIKRKKTSWHYSVKVPTQEEILEIFYPGPYASCKEEKGHFTEDYKGTHRPPTTDYGAPLHNLIKLYPDDVYTNPQYYAVGPEELNSARLVAKYRNKPDKYIIVYRAVPKGVAEINSGDWVSINMKYAQNHSKHPDDPEQDFDVIIGRAKAKDLFTDGNSLAEWGYQGDNKIQCRVL